MDNQGKFDCDGSTYEAVPDQSRLNAQLRRVVVAMRDGAWRTLGEIEGVTGDGQTSISARLRDLRKERFGVSTVERRRRGDEGRGLFEYRLLLSDKTTNAMGSDGKA